MLFNRNNAKKNKEKSHVFHEILHDVVMIILQIVGPMTSQNRWYETWQPRGS